MHLLNYFDIIMLCENVVGNNMTLRLKLIIEIKLMIS